jgi:lipopolysaccharide transport system ATP-binding protein
MSESVIQVENLGKKYIIGHQQQGHGRYVALRDVLTDGAKSLAHRLRHPRKPRPNPNREEFWALKDVSFEVNRGEVVGIIGRNGAGKSTLLKILSRITEPTTGQVRLRGRVASLLEVGTGFHPELTGRENIFLNGAILGMSRAEINRKFDEIVEFAEVSRFLDTPVKRYSSGMYVRLAFAVAAHLEPEILVVDEVLAVGDIEFQKKCLGKIGSISKQAERTVFLVSHNMAAISNICGRCVLLEAGGIKFDGNPKDAINIYTGTSKDQSPSQALNLSRRQVKPAEAEIVDAWIERDSITSSTLFFGDENNEVVLKIRVHQEIRLSVELLFRDQNEIPVIFCPGGLSEGLDFQCKPGSYSIRCKLPKLKLASGQYQIDLILAITGVKFLDYIESGLNFIVEKTAIGNKNWSFEQSRGQGCLLWDGKYSIYPANP